MNYPSRTDPEAVPNGWNQNPNAMASDTNSDSNGVANLREHRDHRITSQTPSDEEHQDIEANSRERDTSKVRGEGLKTGTKIGATVDTSGPLSPISTTATKESALAVKDTGRIEGRRKLPSWLADTGSTIKKFGKFVGPGFMIAVAYIDPGNYATDVAAGASYQYRLLVMILVSNIIAIFLQSLCIKLGSVTGLNLAESCRAHLPRWLNYVLYFLAESAIIATDIAEVIGTAIALNLLLHIPLVAGCAISIVDVLFILLFYRPHGTMKGLRLFELFVMLLVIGVVVCFCIELSLITVPDVGNLFRGYLPSHVLVESQGLYQACGILGATVMPHSLYLGSGIVQPRLRQYDRDEGYLTPEMEAHDADDPEAEKYKPSLAAIRACLKFSIAELALSLFTFALFVNSAILIVAGASLYNVEGSDSADLFGIHDLLSSSLAPAAGTVFALALLLSGTSAGIVCTIAGQMVSEGQLRLSVPPWVRRLITRSISITPSIIIAGAIGKEGLSTALEASQVVLSIILPFTSAPLVYFTCRNKFMTVRNGNDQVVKMRNGWITAFFAIAVWLLIVVMNVALLVLLGLGESG